MAERPRPLRSVRARAALGATAVVAVALVIAAALFAVVLGRGLFDARAVTAESTAEALAGLGSNAVVEYDEGYAQLVDDAGVVLRSSEDAAAIRLPISDEPQQYAVDGEELVVVSVATTGADAVASRLILAIPVDDADALPTAQRLLLLAVPLLVLFVAVTSWIVVGRALAPVSRIRAEVDDIEASSLEKRVAVPDSGDEVSRLAATMNRMLARLDRSQRAQRQFVSDASHELRSPLASIRQHAELARAHPDALPQQELAAIVLDEGARLQGLVDALLLLARLDEGAPLAGEVVDVDDLARDEVARSRGGAVTIDGAGIAPARVRGDRRLLGQVLRNLVDNAARHARSRVVVATAADDGAGVPEELRDRVFERFVRLDEGRAREAGGSGLGLAIVRGIVERHGGTVRLEGSPLGGARVVVRLPAAS